MKGSLADEISAFIIIPAKRKYNNILYDFYKKLKSYKISLRNPFICFGQIDNIITKI